MLRLLVVLLLLANGLYFAWSQGFLASMGLSPANPTEPDRLHQQIKPETVSVVSKAELGQIERQQSTPTVCLQSEVLTPAQAEPLRKRIESATPAWPADSWKFEARTEQASWMIFMGPYANAEQLDKKKQELKRLNVGFDPIHPKSIGPGLLLAASGEKGSLEERLAALNKSGVRTARILPLRPAASGLVLKLPWVTDALQPFLLTVKPDLPDLDGQPLRNCPP
jgi:hypothetical protein